jgi:hypothetical protein
MSQSGPALFVASGLAALVGCGPSPERAAAPAAAPPGGPAAASCSIAYNLPGDVPVNATQATLDTYSWQLFLSLNAPAVGGTVSTTGDNATLWGGSVSAPITSSSPGWSSTDDLLQAVTDTSVPPYGSHFYPPECQAIPDYRNYRVVDELQKVNDDFFEATVKGLSADPVVATNGTFLRYEILLSANTYNQITANRWHQASVLAGLKNPVNFQCGVESAGGPMANPAEPAIGPIVIKNAWMDAASLDAARYHMENLLVFTNGSENSTGQNSCTLKTMALVGMHIAHKTTNQSGWTWSTFEHAANAPDCTTTPAAPPQSPTDGGNKSCPTSAAGGPYNLFPQAQGGKQSQSCNVTPAANQAPGSTPACAGGFCADLPPNPVSGYSSLCRQVPLANYQTAYAQTQACNGATGASSVWSNYSLISTQWFTAFGAAPACQNAAVAVNPQQNRAGYAPQVTMADGKTGFPYLANTSMESYERSVCMGCHQQALTAVAKGGNSVSTDFMYFLQLEVPCAPINDKDQLCPGAQVNGAETPISRRMNARTGVLLKK